MFRPIRLDHTNCLQVAIKTHYYYALALVTQVVGMRATHLKDVSVILIQQYVSRPSCRAAWFNIVMSIIVLR